MKLLVVGNVKRDSKLLPRGSLADFDEADSAHLLRDGYCVKPPAEMLEQIAQHQSNEASAAAGLSSQDAAQISEATGGDAAADAAAAVTGKKSKAKR